MLHVKAMQQIVYINMNNMAFDISELEHKFMLFLFNYLSLVNFVFIN